MSAVESGAEVPHDMENSTSVLFLHNNITRNTLFYLHNSERNF